MIVSLGSMLPTTLPFAMAAPPAEGGGGGLGSMLIPLVLMFAIFYFLIIRPQQRRYKEHQKMVDSLGRGDRILTNGGLYATVQDVKDDMIVAQIADGVKVEIAKSAVASKVTPKGAKPAKADDKAKAAKK